MKNLNFNFEAFDFWPIYDTIKRYYPIGIPFNSDEYKFFRSYHGIKELSSLVLDNIHNEKNYRTRWKAFEKKIKSEFKKTVISTTHAQAPSFSSYIILDRIEQGDISYSKELHFSISLLGPYYSIFGFDTTNLIFKSEKLLNNTEDRPRRYSAINSITTSPFLEYKKYFLRLEQIIKENYLEYRLIPFEIASMEIKGLNVNYIEKEDCSIFNALFHDNFNFPFDINHRGDEYYGCYEWRINNNYS